MFEKGVGFREIQLAVVENRPRGYCWVTFGDDIEAMH
jgi:hypothetical protein